MTDFKVGDRVRRVNRKGVVTDMLPGDQKTFGKTHYAVRWVDWEEQYEPQDDYHLVLRDELRSDSNVDPDHYKFPGGFEVRQISAHLTSFGGQALQYIARSTRLDGKNKGDTVENLEKAIKFLQWEIERVKE